MIPPKREQIRSFLKPFRALVPALTVGVVFSVALSVFSGAGPFDLLSCIFSGAFGGEDAVVTTLGKMTPLLLNGLAVSLAYQVNLLNIGCEGQMTLGALATATAAVTCSSLPSILLVPLSLLMGILVGALWALPGIWLRQRRGVHEVVSTLLMNYVATYLAEFLVMGPLGDGTAMGRTPQISTTVVWHPLVNLGTIGITSAPIVALFLTFLVHCWFSRTVWGYEATATGSNIEAARGAGVNVNRWKWRLFLLSGAVAGLAGAFEVVAVHHRFYRSFSPGYGFDGITTAFLVDTVPGFLCLSSILVASLRSADKWLQLDLGISPNAIVLIQAVLLLSVACRPGFSAVWSKNLVRIGRFSNRHRQVDSTGESDV